MPLLQSHRLSGLSPGAAWPLLKSSRTRTFAGSCPISLGAILGRMEARQVRLPHFHYVVVTAEPEALSKRGQEDSQSKAPSAGPGGGGGLGRCWLPPALDRCDLSVTDCVPDILLDGLSFTSVWHCFRWHSLITLFPKQNWEQLLLLPPWDPGWLPGFLLLCRTRSPGGASGLLKDPVSPASGAPSPSDPELVERVGLSAQDTLFRRQGDPVCGELPLN